MSAELIVLFLLYPLVGICTIFTLARYKMRVAGIVYSVAFFILLLYLPTFTGRNLVVVASSDASFHWSWNSVGQIAWSSIESATGYLSWPFFVAILISVFLCMSAVSVALTAFRFVRTICLRNEQGNVVGFRKPPRTARFSRIILPRRKLCHTLCRYNC